MRRAAIVLIVVVAVALVLVAGFFVWKSTLPLDMREAVEAADWEYVFG